MEIVERVFSRGFDKMKLYFILGLPTETDEDVLGIIEVGKNALAVGKRLGRRATVTVSVSIHVPKPHTPFQWCAQDSLDEAKRKQEMLRQAARGARALKLRLHESGASLLEGILARGDRRLAPVIERAFARGARFDSWDDGLDLERWQEALDHFGVEPGVYLGTIPVTARLPWDHIHVGLEDGFLAREYRKALRSRLSPPCGKAVGMFIHHTNAADASADQRRLVCYDCGVACDMTQMRQERVDRLVAMGAVTPAPAAATPDPAEPRPVRREKPEKYRPLRPGSPPVRWRLRFSKTGPFALLGHLDMIRELPRVLRRAGLRIAYSEGFHPKPEMSFAPALALGVASLCEYIDVKLIDPPGTDELLARLAEQVPPGLAFSAALPLGPTDRGLSRVISGARYVVGVADSALSILGGREGLGARIEGVMNAESVLVRRKTDGIGRTVDVKKSLRALAIGADAASEVLARAGIVGHLLPLELEVAIAPTGTVRLVEIMEALTGDPGFPFLAVRSELVAGDTTPLDLAHCRPVQLVAAAGAAPSSP
jgi:radical SAM-linked protein